MHITILIRLATDPSNLTVEESASVIRHMTDMTRQDKTRQDKKLSQLQPSYFIHVENISCCLSLTLAHPVCTQNDMKLQCQCVGQGLMPWQLFVLCNTRSSDPSKRLRLQTAFVLFVGIFYRLSSLAPFFTLQDEIYWDRDAPLSRCVAILLSGVLFFSFVPLL